MRTTILFFVLAVSVHAQTAHTTCNTNGDTTNCTTPDPNAAYNNGYALGQGMGNLGAGIAIAAARHREAKFCKANPGQNYKGDYCPTPDEQTMIALRTFMLQTPKFHQSVANGEILGTWVDEHHLDRARVNSYKTAWKALRKTGTLELNN